MIKNKKFTIIKFEDDMEKEKTDLQLALEKEDRGFFIIMYGMGAVAGSILLGCLLIMYFL